MPTASVKSGNTINKKCGEIIITIKKNTKNVYSFNCWFCDTICLQMKKFTLHLEQEHVTQLEQTPCVNSEQSKDDKTEIQTVPLVDNIFVGEIKIEDCANDDIKQEVAAENSKIVNKSNGKDDFTTRFQDPLETFEDNIHDISLPLRLENNEVMELNRNQYSHHNNDNEDVEMQNFLDEHHEDHSDISEDYSSESDMKKDNSSEKNPDKRNTKTQEKELTLALIAEYHKNPQLWENTTCNIKQNEDLLQSITDSLNAKLKMNLKLYMVKKKLNFIYKQYEKEIERQLNDKVKSNVVVHSDLWFYENLSFLKNIIENKLKLKKKKPNHKVKPLNDNILCDLIDIYKNYNSLWDVNHLAYTVKDKRHEVMQSMLDEIKNKMNISLDIYTLEKHLNYIHKSFAKDKQLRLQCEVKQQDFQRSCSYLNKCDFLEAHQGPFKCSNCGDVIETYNDYQIHKSLHDGSTPFKCQECGMGFKKISNYTIHAKRHLRVFKFHCEICGKGYPFNAELDLHMRSHTGAQPYLCSVCGEGFRTAISYDNHIRRHEERFKYFCHICKKGFNHMTRLNDHVKAHLNVRDVICTVCGKGFTSRKYLNHHKRIHEGKNYSCNICGKSFAQDAGLRAHKKYHGTPIGISSIQKRTKDTFLTRFHDPLEGIEDNNADEISLQLRLEYNKLMESNGDQNVHQNNEDVEIHNFSEHHEDYSDTCGNYSSKYDAKTHVTRITKAQENELTLALIEEYHKSPQLWKNTTCNVKQKETLIQTITDRLNAKLKMNLKLYMVKKKLIFICQLYEKEIDRQLNENVQNDGTANFDLWSYENMSFLKNIIKSNLKPKKRKRKAEVETLNDNLLCDLIDIYKNYNSLWDVNHLAYTVKDKRHEVMQSMLDEIKNKMNISLDIYTLEKHLNYIHKSFAKDKQLRLQCEVKQQDFQRSCSYLNKCDFLEAHQGPFKCSNCGDVIETYNDYQIHKSLHDGSTPFKCEKCGMGFKKIAYYTLHAKRHLHVYKFHCDICGKGYPFHAELELHMRYHTAAQPYLCSVCGEGFRTAISYDNHIRRHEERFKHYCHICNKGFNQLTRLNDHVKAHLNVRDVICTVCGKAFTSRKYLNHHKRIHEGKNYSCNICGKSFAQDVGLRAHKKFHCAPSRSQ